MSRLIGLLLLLIGLSAFFSACKKNTDTSTPVGSMNAVITGNQWVTGGTWLSTGAIATGIFMQSPAGYTKSLFIAATQSSGTALHGAILMTIDNYKDTSASFNIDNSNNTATYLSINGNDTVVHPGIYGTVTITSGTDKTAYGYFVFTCKDSTKIANGTFNVKIQGQ